MDDVMKKGEKCLVGKFCLDHVVGKEIVRATMAKIWKVNKSFTFHDISPNIFIITFEKQMDKDKVLAGKPWFFL